MTGAVGYRVAETTPLTRAQRADAAAQFTFKLASLASILAAAWGTAGPRLTLYVRRGRIVRCKLEAP